MCGFLLTNVDSIDVARATAFQCLRGPDLTTESEVDGFTLVHNLLSITGPVTPQPFADGNTMCLFNGQVYNYRTFGDFASDGECLLPAYAALGPAFVRELDGEFALAVLDPGRGTVLVASDAFGTKPLYYSTECGRIGVASYESTLRAIGFRDVRRVAPNTYLLLGIDDGEVQSRGRIIDFALNQFKDSFDNWLEAFEEAIGKRSSVADEKLFIGLSSGYDSGGIACELNKTGVPYKSYTIVNNEERAVVERRLAQRPQGVECEIICPSDEEIDEARRYLARHVEPMRYEIRSTRTDRVFRGKLHDDSAAVGLAIICARARKEGRRIYLSGQGSDEILSDYGFGGEGFYGHSNFGGLFPDELETIFPWPSFFGSTQASYLKKEEYVAGAFGIEARYPYLDRQLVQEFLWLSAKLKNSRYKSALGHYLEKNGYPNLFDQKLGFVL